MQGYRRDEGRGGEGAGERERISGNEGREGRARNVGGMRGGGVRG